MDLFKLERHNYWVRHVDNLWAVAADYQTFQRSIRNVTDQNARTFILFLFELMSNVGSLLYAADLDHIPINSQDMQAANLILNDFFQAKGLNHQVEISGGGIRLT